MLKTKRARSYKNLENTEVTANFALSRYAEFKWQESLSANLWIDSESLYFMNQDDASLAIYCLIFYTLKEPAVLQMAWHTN